MKKIRLFLVAMLMCMVTNGMAQDKNTPDTKRAYYIYSWIQLRWANKANGEPCIVSLESSGRGKKQKPSIMKTEDGRSIIFETMMDGLNYLEQKGWELVFEDHDSFSNLLVRRKVTKDELDKTVKENTFFETVAPKLQLTIPEKNAHIDYE